MARRGGKGGGPRSGDDGKRRSRIPKEYPPYTWQPDPPKTAVHLADKLHTAAIHLLRRLRIEDEASGLTAPRFSALSVVVFSPGIRMGELAAAEQVKPPTMTRLVRGLERDGLVRRVDDPADARAQLVEPTEKGIALLQEGRKRRVAALARQLAEMSREEKSILRKAAPLLELLALPDEHPTQLG